MDIKKLLGRAILGYAALSFAAAPLSHAADPGLENRVQGQHNNAYSRGRSRPYRDNHGNVVVPSIQKLKNSGYDYINARQNHRNPDLPVVYDHLFLRSPDDKIIIEGFRNGATFALIHRHGGKIQSYVDTDADGILETSSLCPYLEEGAVEKLLKMDDQKTRDYKLGK